MPKKGGDFFYFFQSKFSEIFLKNLKNIENRK